MKLLAVIPESQQYKADLIRCRPGFSGHCRKVVIHTLHIVIGHVTRQALVVRSVKWCSERSGRRSRSW